MSKSIVFVLLGTVLSVFVFAKEPALVTINGKEISKSSFEYLYHKNNTNTGIDKKSKKEYLSMFIDFKLKVAEAESLKMDTAQSFITELEGYRRQSAMEYLTDKDYKEKLMKEAYERMKEDVEIAHIFVKFDDDNQSDTLKAYKKAQTLYERLKKEDFATLAKEQSEDPASKEKGGYLGYISALKTIYPFETAAYTTPVGKISTPIRSMYGYHIVKVFGKRPSRGKLLLAHILKTTNDTLPEKNIQAENEIQYIYSQLKNGENFEKMVKEFSEDTYSAQKNGQLPWLESGNFIKEFEDAAYQIKEMGDFSYPVKTQFGWHIIKLLDKKQLGTYEEEKPTIEKSFVMGDRAQFVQQSFIAKLKNEYLYKVDKKALEQLQKLAKNTTDSLFYIQAANQHKMLFSFADKTYTQSQLAAFMKQRNLRPSVLQQALQYYSDEEIKNYENSRLEIKYPEFGHLVQEYKDGILLFNISNATVWEKALKDTTGLSQFFEANKANYTWSSPKYKGRIIYCNNAKTEKKVRNIFRTAPSDSIDVELNKLNKEKTVVKSEYGSFEKGAKKEVDYLVFKEGVLTPDADFPIVFVDGKLLSNPENYTDIKGKVVQDYQSYLDKEWIKQLRNKFPVKINEELFKTVKD